MNKEIEELLEKAAKEIGYIDPAEFPAHNQQAQILIDQALTKLREPKCKTCGDRREIEVCDNCYPNRTTQIMQQTNTYPKLIRCVICGKGKPKVIPCPDCKAPEQLLAGEFTRKFRVLLANRDRTVVVQNAYEACKRIDTSEATRKDLLEALEEYSKGVMLLRECKDEITLGAALQLKKADDLGKAAIAKAKKGGG